MLSSVVPASSGRGHLRWCCHGGRYVAGSPSWSRFCSVVAFQDGEDQNADADDGGGVGDMSDLLINTGGTP